MTTQQLQSRFCGALPSGYGHYKVTFEIRGKRKTHTTTNTMALDRIRNDNDGIEQGRFYRTKKQALQVLWNEAMRADETARKMGLR